MAPSSDPPAFANTVRLRLAVAWTGLAWERLSAALWRAATLLAFGLAFALTDVLPSMPLVIHLGLVFVFLAALAALGWYGFRGFAWPSRADARARLEAMSPVSHRPLTAAEDSLAIGATPLQRALWNRHQTLARAALARLRSPWPMSEVARRDGFAVRAIAVLVLAIALIGTWQNAGARLGRAIAPAFGEGNVPVTVKVWITPPAYTNRAPIYLETAAGGHDTNKLEVPAGSKVLALVTGTRRKTDLVMIDAQHRASQTLPLEPVGKKGAENSDTSSRRVEGELTPAVRLEVRQSARMLAGWDVKWIADEAPVVAFDGPPINVGRGRLRIDYTASDDYGIQDVTAHISRDGADGAVDVPLAVPPFSQKEAVQSSLQDVGGNIWAGMKVTVSLTATDQSGQTASSKPIELTLPERTFTHPVARTIAHWRKELLTDASSAAATARQAFSRLLNEPASFNGDRVVFLALASAKYRLSYETAEDAMHGLPDLLWQTAVRIEDGSLGEAEQRLQAAEQALREAMERNAPTDEVNQLVGELQRAFTDYAQAVSEHEGMELGAVDANGDIIKPDDIAKAMDQLKELNKMGAKDAARQMMANLQKMLQSMRNAAAGEPGSNPEVKAAQQMMEKMQDLAARQAQLLDETFEQVRKDATDENKVRAEEAKKEREQAKKELAKAMQQKAEEEKKKAEEADKSADADKKDDKAKDEKDKAEAKAKEDSPGKRAAEKQEKLRQDLQQLSERMNKMAGRTPGSLAEADHMMNQAVQSLQADAWHHSADAQGAALARMENGMHDSAEDMMQALAKKGFQGLVQMPGSQHRFDGPRGTDTEDQLKMPTGPDTEGLAQRVRTIRDEIRRRAADRTRPPAEQEYLRRLMKEF